MMLTGKLLIGQQMVSGREGSVQAINPMDDQVLGFVRKALSANFTYAKAA